MAGDRKQFDRALQKWEHLRERRVFSYPHHAGVVAILYSSYSIKSAAEADQELRIFKRDARRVKGIARRHGFGAETIGKYTRDDIKAVLADRAITSVVTIGHGDISSVYMGDHDDKFDWRDVAEATTHLKTGMFTQRHCGNYMRDVSVPLATFAMMDHRRIFAPAGMSFDPDYCDESARDFEERKVRQVFPSEQASYDWIKLAMPRQYFARSDSSNDS